jgi:hypothetical protein
VLCSQLISTNLCSLPWKASIVRTSLQPETLHSASSIATPDPPSTLVLCIF